MHQFCLCSIKVVNHCQKMEILTVDSTNDDLCILPVRNPNKKGVLYKLLSPYDCTIAPNENFEMSLCFRIEIVMAGYFVILRDRTSVKENKTVVIGNVIDSTCNPQDEVKIKLYNMTPNPYVVKRGDVIGEMVVLKGTDKDVQISKDMMK